MNNTVSHYQDVIYRTSPERATTRQERTTVGGRDEGSGACVQSGAGEHAPGVQRPPARHGLAQHPPGHRRRRYSARERWIQPVGGVADRPGATPKGLLHLQPRQPRRRSRRRHQVHLLCLCASLK